MIGRTSRTPGGNEQFSATQNYKSCGSRQRVRGASSPLLLHSLKCTIYFYPVNIAISLSGKGRLVKLLKKLTTLCLKKQIFKVGIVESFFSNLCEYMLYVLYLPNIYLYAYFVSRLFSAFIASRDIFKFTLSPRS